MRSTVDDPDQSDVPLVRSASDSGLTYGSVTINEVRIRVSIRSCRSHRGNYSPPSLSCNLQEDSESVHSVHGADSQVTIVGHYGSRLVGPTCGWNASGMQQRCYVLSDVYAFTSAIKALTFVNGCSDSML